MDRTFPLILYWFILGFFNLLRVYGNAEVDALNALKTQLQDPYNNLQSWDTTQLNPCWWHHITCNNEESVTQVDLGYAGLSGQLVPQLGQLKNLQYLSLYGNDITGEIPDELGNLTNLLSLELYLNQLEGDIPDTLGNLQKLCFLRLNNNNLTGTIPMSLTTISSLQVVDLSNNFLTGIVPTNGSFSLFTVTSFFNNPSQDPPTAPPNFRTPTLISSRNNAAGAFTTGAIVGVALVFAFQLISLFWRRCRKQQDHFTDVPGEECWGWKTLLFNTRKELQ